MRPISRWASPTWMRWSISHAFWSTRRLRPAQGSERRPQASNRADATETGRVNVHRLARDDDRNIHYAWDPAIPAALVVSPGDEVVVEARSGEDDQVHQ